MRLLRHSSDVALQKKDATCLEQRRVKGKGNGEYLVVVLDLATWRGSLIAVVPPDKVGCGRSTVGTFDLCGRGVDSSSISGTGFKGVLPTSTSVS